MRRVLSASSQVPFFNIAFKSTIDFLDVVANAIIYTSLFNVAEYYDNVNTKAIFAKRSLFLRNVVV